MRNLRIVVVAVCIAGCNAGKAPEPTMSEQQKALVVQAIADGRKLQDAREAKRRTALEGALASDLAVSGPACPIAVHVVGKSDGLVAHAERAFGMDAESRQGRGRAKSPQREAQLRDAKFSTDESTIVSVRRALSTPSQQGADTLEMLDYYAGELRGGRRYSRPNDGEVMAEVIRSMLEEWPKTELIVVEDDHTPSAAHGRAFLYDTATGEIVCAGPFHAITKVAGGADAVLDLKTETLRDAATHLLARK